MTTIILIAITVFLLRLFPFVERRPVSRTEQRYTPEVKQEEVE